MTPNSAGVLLNSFYVLRHAQYTSLLPFLYQTPTLQRLRLKQHKPIDSLGSLQSCNGFSSSSCLRAVSDEIPFENLDAPKPARGRPKSSRVRRVEVASHPDYLPKVRERPPPTTQELRESLLSSPLRDIIQDSPRVPRQPRDRTITAAEHAVFSRIFDDLGAKAVPNAAMEDDSLNDELEANSDPDAYLDRIFEAVIATSRSSQPDVTAEGDDEFGGGEQGVSPGPALTFVDSFKVDPSHNDVISRYPQSLREAAARADQARMNQAGYAHRTRDDRRSSDDENTNTIAYLEAGQTEYGKKVHTARIDDRKKVWNLLDEAETDVEIWKVLEDEVFSIVVRFQEQLKAGEQESGRPAKKATRTKKRGGIDAEATELEQVPHLAILETNYAAHCLYALRLLRKHFRSSPYAMFLLPKIKSLGPISYVLGTSSDLYNELMFIKWREYSDLHGISELGTEMRNRGLAVNQMTLEVLRAVLLMGKQGTKGKYGEVVMAWWELQGSVAGLAKVSGLYGRLWSDYMERRTLSKPGGGRWWELDERGRVAERTYATPSGR